MIKKKITKITNETLFEEMILKELEFVSQGGDTEALYELIRLRRLYMGSTKQKPIDWGAVSRIVSTIGGLLFMRRILAFESAGNIVTTKAFGPLSKMI